MGKKKKKKGGFSKWIVVVLLFLGFGFFMYLGWSPTKFRKSLQNAGSLFFTQLKKALFPPLPDSLNKKEKAFFWAKEFDLALQAALPKIGLASKDSVSTGGAFPLPLKRLIRVKKEIPWPRMRKDVLSLVRERGGRVFSSPARQGRRMIFHLGGAKDASWSYILIFQKEISPPPPKTRSKRGPVVALVIDDLGYNLSLANSLFSLKLNLTVSILPHHLFSRECARQAHNHSLEVMLHLPMQPRRYASKNWEKNTLLVKMSQQEILQIIGDDLKNVPWVVGVNNHMGSLMLEDKKSMSVILKELKKRGLYFLDSRTTPGSVGYDLAKELGVPTAYRNVFLDNKQDLNYIKGQLDLLIKTALRQGKAIGIGHLHPLTIQALKENASKFRDKGITLVSLSKVIE